MTILHQRDAQLCRMADRPEDYERLGLDGASIGAWEDGRRAELGPGSFEWWYFDAHLADGSSLVVVFYTKNPMSPGHPTEPFVSVNLDRPGTEALVVESHHDAADFDAQTNHCAVHIGPNSIEGDLHRYTIHVEHDDLMVDATLVGDVPPWRPNTGHLMFGADDDHTFAWLPSIPQGRVEVDLRIGDQVEHLDGIGYHDHNWGDTAMNRLINHWYWGRAQAGPYSIIASDLTAEKRYGHDRVQVFLLAKGDTIVADDSSKVTVTLEDEHPDALSSKPVADTIVYDYEDGPDRYRVSFHRAQTIVDDELIDQLSGLPHALARLARFDGAYLRFTGDVRLEHLVNGQLVEDVSDPGIWELMYFGHVV